MSALALSTLVIGLLAGYELAARYQRRRRRQRQAQAELAWRALDGELARAPRYDYEALGLQAMLDTAYAAARYDALRRSDHAP